MENPFQPIVYYAVFLFSTTLHEAGHSWAAKRGGDLTAYLGGQVSISPVPHIRREPFGMVLLPLLTVFTTGWPMGFASAPYDPMWARRYPTRAALMSLAGPAANLALILAAALLIRIGIGMGALETPRSVNFSHVVAAGSNAWSAAAFILSVFFSLNLVLFLLNILPVPPLDGSGVLPLFLGKEGTDRYHAIFRQPMLGIAGILIAWRVFAEIFHPIFLVAVNLLHPGARYG